ncbi:PQQ-dependent sugar dehydrogenase [Botrimarina hoheduenensis]|uniref:Quinoprotein glucose dehydrogenase B n=1 Tax=Botrimarina hoheduenensis TaxID=2528000 RepID=A0A5C5WCF1_9BACT|nr:PQQ-dependent sugar dehydrogenase [Botrimarina hoheduenensis]TWT48350.1 Quinoprotein glucose dehydrogenase B precursor [Botrimarina hoheduenensis]
MRLIAGCFFVLSLFGSQALAVSLQAQLLAENPVSEPMFAIAAPGSPDHIFVGSRGTMDVVILDRTTGQTVSTFMNLPNATPVAQDGLLSMAFHPDYDTNGLFYTYTFSNTDPFVRVTERRRSVANPLIADPTYERQIFEMPNERRSHNGGWVGFSPLDGYLYATTGDGGVNNGAANGLPAQDPFDLHGKLLRVDVNGDSYPADPTRNYVIPPTNPYADGVAADPRVFSLGLRHSFRAGFDSQTGDLYIGDVGSVYFEEVNFIPGGSTGGQNFGWRALEGSADNPSVSDPAPPGAIDPIHEYARGSGASIVGGTVYRGSAIPELVGEYFFGDYVRDGISTLRYENGVVTSVTDRTRQLFPTFNSLGSLVSFGEDGLGEMLIIDVQRYDIYRVVAVPSIDGDYNEDGFVDVIDYTVWRDNVGAPAGTLPNDPNSSVIGPDQYATWVAEYGSVAASAAVPEPSALFLVVIGGALLATRR